MLGQSHQLLFRSQKSSPSSSSFDNQAAHHTCRHGEASYNGDAHETLLCHLLVNERTQAGRLEIGRLLLQKQIVVSAGFSIVSQLIVAQSKIVKTFSSSLGCPAEDLGEKAHTFLLVGSSI